MPYFRTTCVFLAPSGHSVEIVVDGETQIEDVNASSLKDACGLHGRVSVGTKYLNDDETQFYIVGTYRDLAEILKEISIYKSHLDTVIDYYGKGPNLTDIPEPTPEVTADDINDGIEESVAEIDSLRAHYIKIRDDISPAGFAIRNIVKGVNNFGSKVWLRTSCKPEERITPPRPPRPSVAATAIPFREYMSAYHEASKFK